MRRILLALAGFALLAGCTNGPGGQSGAYEGALVYNGTSGGTQTETAECGATGTLHWSMNLAYGSLRVTILDAAGATKYQESASGTSQTAHTKPVTGAPGTWTMRVERTPSNQYGSSMWSGQYAAYLDC